MPEYGRKERRKLVFVRFARNERGEYIKKARNGYIVYVCLAKIANHIRKVPLPTCSRKDRMLRPPKIASFSRLHAYLDSDIRRF